MSRAERNGECSKSTKDAQSRKVQPLLQHDRACIEREEKRREEKKEEREREERESVCLLKDRNMGESECSVSFSFITFVFTNCHDIGSLFVHSSRQQVDSVMVRTGR